MRVIRCPNCQEPLPLTANFCAQCGEYLFASKPSFHKKDESLESPTIKTAHRPAALKVSRFHAVDTGANASTQRAGTRTTASSSKPRRTALVSGSNGLPPPTQSRVSRQEDIDNGELRHRATWEKIVTYKTPRIPPVPVNPPATPAASKAPAGSTPPALISIRKTPPKKPPRMPTRLFSWVSIVVLIGLLLGGVFGLVVSFSRGILAHPSHNSSIVSLQVTPSTVALGGMITLRGSNFSSSGRVGLTRDTNIALADTGGTNILRANAEGSFSDTVIVDPSWGAGSHSIRAEDAVLHKSASFTVTVTGQSTSLRPAHLLTSMNAIDLGSGDQVTNSTQMITLSNAGGGQITWQATATQSWLLVSPQSGTFSYGQNMQVVVAADRSNLEVGAYGAGVIFTSNTGRATLPVKMSVTQLQPGHEAILQLTPAVLSFTGTDGGTNPPAQVVTVSNPGVLALQWSASSSTNDGSSWLSVYPQSGTVTRGGSQAVTIGVDTSTLLPGVYSGSVTFASQGAVAAKGSPQTIYVSLVVWPQCAIQVSPGGLTFAGVYLQPPPAQQIISVGVSQGCGSSLQWSASVTTSSGGNWLSVGPTGGVTPTNPSVSVTTTGLNPGTYTGSVIFTWPGGTQTLPVTFIVGQPATPIVTVTPATMAFSGVIGQTGPQPQTIVVTNTGGGTLTWHASAATAMGGAWLAITPVKGTLASHLSATIMVTATPLGALTAGTYTGTITITGTDGLGNPAAGSPISIPVNFVVQAPCAIATTPPALVFQGVAGQSSAVASQPAAISASGACAHALTWTATTATTPAGGMWLTATPATGTVSLKAASATRVGIVLTGLTAGSYAGKVTLTAIDSVTKLAVGKPVVVTVTLTVHAVCTLQAPSVTAETFSSEAGTNPKPATQTFTVGITGTCTGKVIIMPTATMTNGTGWLAVSPAKAAVASGASATFNVKVASAALAVGSYTGSISLAAVNVTGSPQAVGVTLNVLAPPALTAGPGKMTFNVSSGKVSKPVTITNTGGGLLNWTAALDAGAPSYVSLSATSGTKLMGGKTATIRVIVDATGLPGGTSVTTSVVVSAIDPITGLPVKGSPSTISVTIKIPPSPTPTPTPSPSPSPSPTPSSTPQMALSLKALTFTTPVGNNPTAQTINVQNTGGGTLKWTAGTPSQTWLAVTPTTGSDAAGQTTPLAFSVDVTGMTAGTYSATVIITPSVGKPVTVNVKLKIH